jgi:hypothetical protein
MLVIIALSSFPFFQYPTTSSVSITFSTLNLRVSVMIMLIQFVSLFKDLIFQKAEEDKGAAFQNSDVNM